MKKSLLTVFVLAVFSLLPGTARGDCIWPDPFLPPHLGIYRSPAEIHARYHGAALLVILSKIEHRGFGIPTNNAIANGTHEAFDSTVLGMVSINGSPESPMMLAGPVGVDLFDGYTPGALGTFHTEMVSLDLSGPAGVKLRESPTLVSTGQTTISHAMGGGYHIDSFFDIFTELSVDNGATWIPSDTSTHVDLCCADCVPEPSTLALLGLGGIGFAFNAYRRRRSIAV